MIPVKVGAELLSRGRHRKGLTFWLVARCFIRGELLQMLQCRVCELGFRRQVSLGGGVLERFRPHQASLGRAKGGT